MKHEIRFKKAKNTLKTLFIDIDKLFDIDRFYAVLFDNRNDELLFPYVVSRIENSKWEELKWDYRRLNPDLLPDLVINNKKPVFLENNFQRELKEIGAQYWPYNDSPYSWMGVPMITSDAQTIGALIVENMHTIQAFGKDAINKIGKISEQLTAVIVNTEFLERKITLMESVNKFGSELTSKIQSTESDILELIHQRASDIMDTKNMYIALYHSDTSKPDDLEKNIINGKINFEIMNVEVEGRVIKNKKWSREVKKGQYGRTEEIIISQKPILIKSKEESEKWYNEDGRKEFIGESFASWIGVPIKSNINVLGVIATYHKTKEYLYDEDDLMALRMMANYAAVAIENVRSIKEQKRQADKYYSEFVSAIQIISGEFAHRLTNYVGTTPTWIRRIDEILINSQLKNNVSLYLNKIKNNNNELFVFAEKFKYVIKQIETLNNKEWIHLKTVIENIIKKVSEDVENQKIVYKLNIENEHIRILSYKDHLSQTLSDIIKNAVDAIQEEGQIMINCSLLTYKNMDTISIQITDTGHGIPKDAVNRIFEAFYSTKVSKGGIGLGLYLSKMRLDRMGGTIDVLSENNQGTTFIIQLPIESDSLRTNKQ